MKHTLSPVVEYALVATVAAYGLFGIYLSSLRPFIIAADAPVTSVNEPVPLAADLWTRHDARVLGYAYATPPGWLVDDADLARIRIGRSSKELAAAGRDGEGILVELIPLYEGKGIEDAAASDFAGSRPALFDVSVDGRPALYAVAFQDGRVARQAVYIPMGDHATVVRSARADPAVFAAFLSDIRFYSPEAITPTP